MAPGAAEGWCGAVWRTTPESEVEALPKKKLLAADSDATVRSRVISGKTARLLRSRRTQIHDMVSEYIATVERRSRSLAAHN